MIIKSAKFISSSPDLKSCPGTDLPEFAFIGRSNVGKSSLINMITGRKSLAKVSHTPGKTRLINHFLINDEWYLVDLPGYGFAKISKEVKNRLHKAIEGYVLKRKNLKLIFLLIDSRLQPQRIDLEFMTWLTRNKVHFIILFTKADKLSKTRLEKNIYNYRKSLIGFNPNHEEIIPTSIMTYSGREEILQIIKTFLNITPGR